MSEDGRLAAAGDLVDHFRFSDRYERCLGRHFGTGCWWFEDLDGDGTQDLVIGRIDTFCEPGRPGFPGHPLASLPP